MMTLHPVVIPALVCFFGTILAATFGYLSYEWLDGGKATASLAWLASTSTVAASISVLVMSVGALIVPVRTKGREFTMDVMYWTTAVVTILFGPAIVLACAGQSVYAPMTLLLSLFGAFAVGILICLGIVLVGLLKGVYFCIPCCYNMFTDEHPV